MSLFEASIGSEFEIVDVDGAFEAIVNMFEMDVGTLIRLGDGEQIPEARKVPTGGTADKWLRGTSTPGQPAVWDTLPVGTTEVNAAAASVDGTGALILTADGTDSRVEFADLAPGLTILDTRSGEAAVLTTTGTSVTSQPAVDGMYGTIGIGVENDTGLWFGVADGSASWLNEPQQGGGSDDIRAHHVPLPWKFPAGFAETAVAVVTMVPGALGDTPEGDEIYMFDGADYAAVIEVGPPGGVATIPAALQPKPKLHWDTDNIAIFNSSFEIVEEHHGSYICFFTHQDPTGSLRFKVVRGETHTPTAGTVKCWPNDTVEIVAADMTGDITIKINEALANNANPASTITVHIYGDLGAFAVHTDTDIHTVDGVVSPDIVDSNSTTEFVSVGGNWRTAPAPDGADGTDGADGATGPTGATGTFTPQADQTITGNISGSTAIPSGLTPSQTLTLLALVKADVGLGNVDNTADTAKPISTATQTALNAKQAGSSRLTEIAALNADGTMMRQVAGVWIASSYTDVKTALAVTAADVGAVPTTRTVTAGTGLTGGGALSANISLAPDFGTASGKVAQGNDSRFTDARTPTSHASTHLPTGSDPIAVLDPQPGPKRSGVTARILPGHSLGATRVQVTRVANRLYYFPITVTEPTEIDALMHGLNAGVAASNTLYYGIVNCDRNLLPGTVVVQNSWSMSTGSVPDQALALTTTVLAPGRYLVFDTASVAWVSQWVPAVTIGIAVSPSPHITDMYVARTAAAISGTATAWDTQTAGNAPAGCPFMLRRST